MGSRNVSRQADALALARERRRALDRFRDEHDQRVEAATAVVLVALESRAAAQTAMEAAGEQVGSALRSLIAENVSVDRAAALVEIDAADVRKLVRTSTKSPNSAPKAAVQETR